MSMLYKQITARIVTIINIVRYASSESTTTAATAATATTAGTAATTSATTNSWMKVFHIVITHAYSSSFHMTCPYRKRNVRAYTPIIQLL